jgi:tetratricopeptide (TPR) repeat protein
MHLVVIPASQMVKSAHFIRMRSKESLSDGGAQVGRPQRVIGRKGTFDLCDHRTMGNLANTLRNLGEFTEARGLLVQVFEWRKAHLGMDRYHRDTYQTVGRLAHTLRNLGELAEARGLEEQVLEWRKAYLEMGHLNTYQIMGNLALTLHKLSELAEARGLGMQALEWQKEHLGLKHSDTIRVMKTLATWKEIRDRVIHFIFFLILFVSLL